MGRPAFAAGSCRRSNVVKVFRHSHPSVSVCRQCGVDCGGGAAVAAAADAGLHAGRRLASAAAEERRRMAALVAEPLSAAEPATQLPAPATAAAITVPMPAANLFGQLMTTLATVGLPSNGSSPPPAGNAPKSTPVAHAPADPAHVVLAASGTQSPRAANRNAVISGRPRNGGLLRVRMCRPRHLRRSMLRRLLRWLRVRRKARRAIPHRPEATPRPASAPSGPVTPVLSFPAVPKR